MTEGIQRMFATIAADTDRQIPLPTMTYDEAMSAVVTASPDDLAARERRRFAKGSMVG